MNAKIAINKATKAYRRRGVTTMELASVVVLLIVIMALSIDLGILIFASDACDKACKDCARAAGTCASPGQAIDAMNAALVTHGVDGFMLSNLQAQLLVYEDYSTLGGTVTSSTQATPVQTTTAVNPAVIPAPDAVVDTTVARYGSRYSPGPYVVVHTSLTAHVPVPILFFGVQFNGNNALGPNTMQFQSIYCYPITNTYAPTLFGSEPPIIPPSPPSDTVPPPATTTPPTTAPNNNTSSQFNNNSTTSSADNSTGPSATVNPSTDSGTSQNGNDANFSSSVTASATATVTATNSANLSGPSDDSQP